MEKNSMCLDLCVQGKDAHGASGHHLYPITYHGTSSHPSHCLHPITSIPSPAMGPAAIASIPASPHAALWCHLNSTGPFTTECFSNQISVLLCVPSCSWPSSLFSAASEKLKVLPDKPGLWMCGNLENLGLSAFLSHFFLNVNFISCRRRCSLDCSSLWDLSKRGILKELSGATFPPHQHGDKASAWPPASQR